MMKCWMTVQYRESKEAKSCCRALVHQRSGPWPFSSPPNGAWFGRTKVLLCSSLAAGVRWGLECALAAVAASEFVR